MWKFFCSILVLIVLVPVCEPVAQAQLTKARRVQTANTAATAPGSAGTATSEAGRDETTGFASHRAFADEEDFFASIPKSLPGLSLSARGDVTGDGLEDMAIVAASEDSVDRYRQLFVLTQDTDGQYRVAESSIKSPVIGLGCCWVDHLEIRKESVYVNNGAKTACSIENAVHQFKFYKGVWRLVGLKISFYEHCDHEMAKDVDINMLTGKTDHSIQVGDHSIRRWITRSKTGTSLLRDFNFLNGFGKQVQ